jgi:UDP-3-O-[3-hydroxymyristoyl] glucosamine N-acyltransferase
MMSHGSSAHAFEQGMKLNRTVAEVAALVGGRVEGSAERRLLALLPPERAGPDDLAAVFRSDSASSADDTRAGCLLVPENSLFTASDERSLVRVADASAALDALALAVAPRPRTPAPGVHPSAVVEPGARIAPDATVMPLAYVAAGASIGPRCRLWPGAYVGEDAVLGPDCELQAGAKVMFRCILGARVVLKPGAVIGADGFGFRQDRQGRHIKIPQVGIVELGDDVEIGANASVDRARFDVTRIGRGTKIDAQVHIGHNCVLGEDCAMAGKSGLSGSVTLENRVLIGGLAGVASGVRLREGTRVGGMSMVIRDTEAGSYVVGAPARPQQQWAREALGIERLPALAAEVKKLLRPKGGDDS